MLQNLITPFDIIFNALCLFNFLYNSLTQKKRRNINTFTQQLYFQIVLLFFQTYRMRKRFFFFFMFFFFFTSLTSCYLIFMFLCLHSRVFVYKTNPSSSFFNKFHADFENKNVMSISFLLFSTIAIPLICVRISAFQFL